MMFDKLLKTVVYHCVQAFSDANGHFNCYYKENSSLFLLVINNAMLVKTWTLNIVVLFYYSFQRKC